MKVFITGATGVLGKTVSRLLIDAGHDVRGLARNAGSESRIRGLGIEPVPASLFDPPSLRRAMQGCDAVLHLATRIPPPNQARRREAWSENDRIRIEGTWNLVDVALESAVSTFIYPSVVLVYPDRGAHWIDAATPPQSSSILRSTLTAEAEVERFTRTGRRGIVLRMGGFYGPTAGSTREILRMARRGIAMIFGPARRTSL